MDEAKQTRQSFQDKWNENRQLAFSETLREGSDIRDWILTRNGKPTLPEFQGWLAGRGRILDAGCGNGRVTALLRANSEPETEVVGIDLTAAEVARENLNDAANVAIFERDLLADLSDLGQFDLIYCQEVLHHTTDPEGAFRNLCQLLTPAGEIAIYVYKQKAPMREHADDFIRAAISDLPYSEASSAVAQLTELGKTLSEAAVTVNVPKVDLLGIEAGEYDIQRFLYHFFLKCFWNPDLSFEDNTAINYDWYHPQLCSRHTIEEVRSWFESASLDIVHECVDHYGITVRGTRLAT